MTQPVAAQSTQTRHPWRATLRTAVAAAVALLSLLPMIATVGHIDELPAMAQLLAVAAGVTRVLAIPAVETWLHQFAPWLAAQPAQPIKEETENAVTSE